jgi:uncharacterized protein
MQTPSSNVVTQQTSTEQVTIALTQALQQAQQLLQQFTELLPPSIPDTDWQATAFRWRKRTLLGTTQGYLQAIHHIATISAEDLQHISPQKESVLQNTHQFIQGLPANHVLLTGARGTGKSSLIRACLTTFSDRGLRLIEVDKHDLVDLADIVDIIAARPERFIIFCDDLSFETNETEYKTLKVVLDGSIARQTQNVLIYATSNRRHLMPETMKDNLSYHYSDDGELHPGEVVEEKISLSERFGLWLHFYSFDQDEYLAIVNHWLHYFGLTPTTIESARADALRFALQRGSRSGRVARQFAQDYAGRQQLKQRLTD